MSRRSIRRGQEQGVTATTPAACPEPHHPVSFHHRGSSHSASLLSTYCVPGPVLSLGMHHRLTRTEMVLDFLEPVCSLARQTVNTVNRISGNCWDSPTW